MVRRLIASAEELSKRKCPEGAPDLTDCSLAVEFEDTETTCVDFKDHNAFHLPFGDEVEIIGEIVTLLFFPFTIFSLPKIYESFHFILRIVA